MNIDRIAHYFPDLEDEQLSQLEQLVPLYREWNAQINVVSRKDIDNLLERHVLHSLAIAKEIRFLPGTEVLDLGTGGGFPGIPLAIFFPETKFTLIDGIRKKITVVEEVTKALGLTNVEYKQARAEEMKGRKFDFIVTRAVAKMNQLLLWTPKLYKKEQQNAIPNGIFALKGGDLREELNSLPRGTYCENFELNDYFDEPFFAEKQLIYVQA